MELDFESRNVFQVHHRGEEILQGLLPPWAPPQPSSLPISLPLTALLLLLLKFKLQLKFPKIARSEGAVAQTLLGGDGMSSHQGWGGSSVTAAKPWLLTHLFPVGPGNGEN